MVNFSQRPDASGRNAIDPEKLEMVIFFNRNASRKLQNQNANGNHCDGAKLAACDIQRPNQLMNWHRRLKVRNLFNIIPELTSGFFRNKTQDNR
jgi:hypothetical protein